MFEQAVAFLGTANAERSRHFYEEVLGLRLMEETVWAMVFDLRDPDGHVLSIATPP